MLYVLLEQSYGIASDRFRDGDEFDNVDPSLAAFNFGNERLRFAEPVCQVLLDDSCILPCLLQQGQEASVIRGMKGLAHAPSGEGAPGKLILKADYPKMPLRLDFPPTRSNPVSGYSLRVRAMAYTLSREAEIFLAQTQFIAVDAIRGRRSIVPTEPGIYGWWFDDALSVPHDDCCARNGLHLLYVGIAPSATPKDGVKPRTLRDRLLNHCRGPLATSTLRRTLAALLKEQDHLSIDRMPSGKLRMSPEDEAKLTQWMTQHACVTWLRTPAPWLVEKEVLKRGPRLPLNISGSPDPYRKELTALKAASFMRTQGTA